MEPLERVEKRMMYYTHQRVDADAGLSLYLMIRLEYPTQSIQQLLYDGTINIGFLSPFEPHERDVHATYIDFSPANWNSPYDHHNDEGNETAVSQVLKTYRLHKKEIRENLLDICRYVHVATLTSIPERLFWGTDYQELCRIRWWVRGLFQVHDDMMRVFYVFETLDKFLKNSTITISKFPNFTPNTVPQRGNIKKHYDFYSDGDIVHEKVFLNNAKIGLERLRVKYLIFK